MFREDKTTMFTANGNQLGFNFDRLPEHLKEQLSASYINTPASDEYLQPNKIVTPQA
jgi:hypothetical protein